MMNNMDEKLQINITAFELLSNTLEKLVAYIDKYCCKKTLPVKVTRHKDYPDAVIPEYATSGAAGFDFVAAEDAVISPGATRVVSTGLCMAIPEGYEIQVRRDFGRA